MKIDTSKKVENVKGEPYKVDGADLTVGHVLAEALSSLEVGGKMKLFLLAQKAFKSDALEVDEADKALIVKALEACTTYKNNIIIGQALLAVEDTK
jgi:hypothetical protein